MMRWQGKIREGRAVVDCNWKEKSAICAVNLHLISASHHENLFTTLSERTWMLGTCHTNIPKRHSHAMRYTFAR
ncbi:unnamed protein product [Brugia timori]|uniref:Uncharacterized protein n=1 Tax=Brugia timori TaxID=42155 RepID=A0A0R3R7C9_9BILA|nr:unnamed protein product [Brugia timori]